MFLLSHNNVAKQDFHSYLQYCPFTIILIESIHAAMMNLDQPAYMYILR